MADQKDKSRVVCLTLGTAGHIDHGKSALVEKLTGIDPDRLKEEQLRGMTIDLGYAFYETRGGRRVGIIDVPGHEKFVRNMVTGAASVDIVILTVAADDGVMPQTREHLDIMTIMGIRHGLVALTKIDLVDREMVELAAEDVKEMVEGTFLESSPVVPVSAVTGEGMDLFVNHLEELIDRVEHQAPSGLFRMPIQRVFSAKGFGTVVTGVPVSGSVRAGDTVEVLPPGLKGKVRGLQAFGHSMEEGKAGHRIAVNIADVDYHAVHRGCILNEPGFFEPALFFEGRYTHFKDLDFPMKNMIEVKIHTGTAEEMGTLVLLDTPMLRPGEEGYVQARLESPVVVAPGDHFLIRRHSPALSLGGGRIVSVSSGKVKRFKAHVLEELEARCNAILDAPESLAALEMRLWRNGFFTSREIARAVSQPVDWIEALIRDLKASDELIDAGRDLHLHRDRYIDLAGAVTDRLEALHRARPLKDFIDVNVLRSSVTMEERALQNLLKMMHKDGRVEVSKGGMIRKADHCARLDGNQERLAEELGAILTEALLSPPAPAELAERLEVDAAVLEELMEFLKDQGILEQVGGYYFTSQAIDQLKEAVIRCAREHGEVKIPLIRDTFSTTRKYLIPLMEYLDDQGVTRREGERRFLA